MFVPLFLAVSLPKTNCCWGPQEKHSSLLLCHLEWMRHKVKAACEGVLRCAMPSYMRTTHNSHYLLCSNDIYIFNLWNMHVVVLFVRKLARCFCSWRARRFHHHLTSGQQQSYAYEVFKLWNLCSFQVFLHFLARLVESLWTILAILCPSALSLYVLSFASLRCKDFFALALFWNHPAFWAPEFRPNFMDLILS